jgi:hypothetical protein
MKLRKLICLIIAFIIIAICSEALSMDGFSGQVSDASDNKGISNLVIKLTPPRDSKESQPQKITTTNYEGKFMFTGLKQARYLFEIYQGPMLLYRDVVDVNQETNRTIKLKTRE